MPVVRNPQFNFREGFCWSLINGTRSSNDLKFRISNPCVNDVGGMTLHSTTDKFPDFLCVCIGNSSLINHYTESFINFTVNFQVNDVRQIPVVIPDTTQKESMEELFKTIYKYKKKGIGDSLTLSDLESKMNKLVESIYNL